MYPAYISLHSFHAVAKMIGQEHLSTENSENLFDIKLLHIHILVQKAQMRVQHASDMQLVFCFRTPDPSCDELERLLLDDSL
jgi:hypothetical protein